MIATASRSTERTSDRYGDGASVATTVAEVEVEVEVEVEKYFYRGFLCGACGPNPKEPDLVADRDLGLGTATRGIR